MEKPPEERAVGRVHRARARRDYLIWKRHAFTDKQREKGEENTFIRTSSNLSCFLFQSGLCVFLWIQNPLQMKADKICFAPLWDSTRSCCLGLGFDILLPESIQLSVPLSVTVLLVNTVSRAFAEKMWKNMKVQFVKNKEQNQSKTAVTLTVSLQMFLSRFVLLNRRCWKEIWAHLQDYKLIQAFSQVLVNPDCFSW